MKLSEMEESKFKFIEDYRDRHKGKEIWIIGTGPSLDDYPDGFFDGKITIALKAAICCFPHSSYFCSSLIGSRGTGFILRYLQHGRTDLLKRCIIPLRERHQPKWEESIYMNVRGRVDKDYYITGIEKIRKKIPARYGCQHIAQIAIQAAVILGAQKTILAGCDRNGTEWRWHAQKVDSIQKEEDLRVFGPPPFSASFWKSQTDGKPWAGRIDGKPQPQTKWLAEILEPHGIEVVRFFYKKGYEKIA